MPSTVDLSQRIYKLEDQIKNLLGRIVVLENKVKDLRTPRYLKVDSTYDMEGGCLDLST